MQTETDRDSCAPHGACELKSFNFVAAALTLQPRCAPHGACELKFSKILVYKKPFPVAPRMGRVS